MSNLNHWRGLKSLVLDGVSHGAEAVRRIQLETVRRPVELLEKVPLLATPAKAVQAVHTVAVTATHGCIQLATAAVGVGVDVALDLVESASAEKPARPATAAGAEKVVADEGSAPG